MGMAYSITKVSSFFTNSAFCHDCTSLTLLGIYTKIHNTCMIAESVEICKRKIKKSFIFMKKFFLEMDSGSMLWYTSRITTGLRIRIFTFLQEIQAPAFILMEMEAGL